ncbi:MAG: ATP-binding protein [Saprospiraceae bacterium]
MKSPFKFLDAFTLQDKDSFFGRDQEIETIYSLVFKTPMLLVYGLSGTGKTSLVQCGLASRFDGPDWYPIFIRRNDNINTSTATAMNHALGNLAKDNLAENVSILLRKTLRPVYLLFDQFEELFILGHEDEQKKFMNSLRELLDTQLPSKIILIMREEYIGQLYNYETLIPELFDFRFRVEPMGPGKIKNVIESSFDKFNIHLAEPKEELLDAMVHNISDPRAGITLPYLQVYLDMLYRDRYKKQYGAVEQTGYPKIDISKSDIESIGKIDNVLERFLDDQTRELRGQLSQNFKNVNPNVIQKVLDIFVSEEGTKRPVAYKQSGNDIVLTDDTASPLKDVPAPLLTEILTSLQSDRILRRSDENFELAHDSLALVIDGKRSESQRQLQNVRKRLLNAYEEYQKTGAFLNQKQLASFEEYIPHLGLPQEISLFMDKCEEEVVRHASEEKDRLQAENRVTQQKKLARTRGIWLTIAIGLAAFAAYLAYQSNERANVIQSEKFKGDDLYTKSIVEKDSINNILRQVDQQLSRLEKMTTEDLKKEELIKTVITLKSLLRKDTMEKAEMAAEYISVIRIFTTANIDGGPEKSAVDTVFQTSRVYVVLNLSTPQPKEFIQVKWVTSNGEVLGEPYYAEVKAGPEKSNWITANTTIKIPGNYRVEIINSLGVEVGREDFRIAPATNDEVSMTEESEFRTMASGSLNAPGTEMNTFEQGQMIHYWFRLNIPKGGEVITVILLDADNKKVWEDKFTTAVNTGKGFRGWRYHGAREPGKYTIKLVNSKGDELAKHEITIEVQSPKNYKN